MTLTALHQIRAAIDAANLKISAGMRKTSDPSMRVVFFMACLCALLPLDISQLAFAILGAAMYAMLQKQDKLTPKKPPTIAMKHPVACTFHKPPPKPKPYPSRPARAPAVSSKPVVQRPEVHPDVRQPSTSPIVAPSFQSKGWDGEIQELLVRITPTSEVQDIVSRLAVFMTRTMKITVPEVEVSGFANGNLNSGTAFGVAVPEVDVVATVSPQVLFNRLHGRGPSKTVQDSAVLDVKRIQKSAIRVFTDKLVNAGFKFRRSAFRGQEPKVTLLVPASLGIFSEAIPIDFAVNVVTPLYNAALLTECGMMDPRAKELVLVVKRWAKDRGICHAAKGHLSPYLWGLLSMYFLQVGEREEGPLLPPFEQFARSSALATQPNNVDCMKSATQTKWKPPQTQAPRKSVGVLFKAFVHFFHAEFDWQKEAVSLRAGRRAAPSMDLPIHVIVSDDSSTTQAGPSIEDPFQPKQNLGDCMNALSLARLKEELARAEALCTQDESLSKLLEPWAPLDTPQAEMDCEDQAKPKEN